MLARYVGEIFEARFSFHQAREPKGCRSCLLEASIMGLPASFDSVSFLHNDCAPASGQLWYSWSVQYLPKGTNKQTFRVFSRNMLCIDNRRKWALRAADLGASINNLIGQSCLRNEKSGVRCPVNLITGTLITYSK